MRQQAILETTFRVSGGGALTSQPMDTRQARPFRQFQVARDATTDLTPGAYNIRHYHVLYYTIMYYTILYYTAL